FRERQTIGRSVGGKRVQESGNARSDSFIRSEKVAAFEQMRIARQVAFIQYQLRRAFRVLLPQFSDLPVRFAEFRNGRAPVTEDGWTRRGRPGFGGDQKNLARGVRREVGQGVRRGRNRKPEAPKTVLLIVVVIPPAMSLIEVKRQNRAAFIRN